MKHAIYHAVLAGFFLGLTVAGLAVGKSSAVVILCMLTAMLNMGLVAWFVSERDSVA